MTVQQWSAYVAWVQLYTSGSTGKPKGVEHTTGGYMVGAATTFKYVFDYRPDDVYWCTADCGWITGHSYVTYGELHRKRTPLPKHLCRSRWCRLQRVSRTSSQHLLQGR